jgi:hypothetical protein
MKNGKQKRQKEGFSSKIVMFFWGDMRFSSKIVMYGVGILRFSSKIVMFLSPPCVLAESLVVSGLEDTKVTKIRRG